MEDFNAILGPVDFLYEIVINTPWAGLFENELQAPCAQA